VKTRDLESEIHQPVDAAGNLASLMKALNRFLIELACLVPILAGLIASLDVEKL
jgi:hypothetical protein